MEFDKVLLRQEINQKNIEQILKWEVLVEKQKTKYGEVEEDLKKQRLLYDANQYNEIDGNEDEYKRLLSLIEDNDEGEID